MKAGGRATHATVQPSEATANRAPPITSRAPGVKPPDLAAKDITGRQSPMSSVNPRLPTSSSNPRPKRTATAPATPGPPTAGQGTPAPATRPAGPPRPSSLGPGGRVGWRVGVRVRVRGGVGARRAAGACLGRRSEGRAGASRARGGAAWLPRAASAVLGALGGRAWGPATDRADVEVTRRGRCDVAARAPARPPSAGFGRAGFGGSPPGWRRLRRLGRGAVAGSSLARVGWSGPGAGRAGGPGRRSRSLSGARPPAPRGRCARLGGEPKRAPLA